MWKWFNCYLSGRHDFGVWCERGEIFLRCVHCGQRSVGWSIENRPHVTAPVDRQRVAASAPIATPIASATAPNSRVLPFNRAAAR